jgi:hypothetical protein
MKQAIKIKAIEPLPELVLLVSFDDGRRVRFDPTEYLAGYAGYDVFSVAPGLFQCAKIDKSRTHVCWTESVFLPADVIYENGRIVEDC